MASLIDVKVDTKQYLDELGVRQDQQRFTASLALNIVTQGALAFARAKVKTEFTIAPSKETFIESLIRFPKSAWSTKERLYTTVGIDGDEGDVGVGSDKNRGFLLGRHEAGGIRTRTDPLRPFFIPTDELRGGEYDLPPHSMYPVALGLMEGRGVVSYTTIVNPTTGKTRKKAVIGNKLIKSHITATGKLQIQGKRGTFLLGPMNAPGDPRIWGIYQRTGPGRRDVRMIWAFRTSIDLPPRLHFYDAIDAYVQAHMQEAFEEAAARAMATAR